MTVGSCPERPIRSPFIGVRIAPAFALGPRVTDEHRTIHIGLDLLAGAIAPTANAVNSAGVLLFIAVSLGVQGLVTMQRARSLPGAPVLAGVR